MNKFVAAAIVTVVSSTSAFATQLTVEDYKTLNWTDAQIESYEESLDKTFDQDNVLGNNNFTNNYAESGKTVYEDGSGDTHTTTNTTTVESFKPQGYVSNPNLTTSGADTCFGSKSSGISGPGFGISGGETVVDQNCIMLKNAKILATLGLKDAAVLLLMNSNDQIAAAVWGANPDIAEALTSVSQ